MQISAAISRDPAQPFSVEAVDIDDPREGEVLVRVAACGICHTDIGMRALVPQPVVLGHEGSGVVEKVGPGVAKVAPGDPVVMTFGSCGTCPQCQIGKPSYCDHFRDYNFACVRPDGSHTLSQNGSNVHGGFFSQSSFATYAMGTERSVVKVAADLPLELLGPLGCGFQTGAGAVLNSFAAPAGSSIAVFGAGSVGLSAIMAAQIAGCQPIIAVDIMEARLDVARSLGATHTVNAREGDPVEEINKIIPGGVHYSLESTGVPETLPQVIGSLRQLGVAGLLGAAREGHQIPAGLFFPGLGRTVKGIAEGDSIPDLFIPRLIEMYLAGHFPMDRLVTYYDFDDINTAIDDAAAGRCVKPILRMP